MLSSLERRAAALAAARTPFTSVVGLARTMLALATAGTLAATAPQVIFSPAAEVAEIPPVCGAERAASLFCTLPREDLTLMRWAAVVLLLVVASGWRPRVTGVLHAWVAWSLQASGVLVDGGDQVASNLALLLVPLTLADARRWHWSDDDTSGSVARVVAQVSLFAARLQVAGVYFHAAAGKFGHEEWSDGTAVYYWFTHPFFGAPAWLRGPLTSALEVGVVVALIAWGTIVLEFFLAAAPWLPRRTQRMLFPMGVALHLGIVLIHGLVSFVTTMWAALVLLLLVPSFGSLRELAPRLAIPRFSPLPSSSPALTPAE
jgi:antimicrobial peptide system SdpB family protein